MVFFKYLRQCRRCILGMVLCLGIYGAIFAMYKEPWAAIWYPAVLCVLVGVILFVAGFWRITGGIKNCSMSGTILNFSGKNCLRL